MQPSPGAAVTPATGRPSTQAIEGLLTALTAAASPEAGLRTLAASVATATHAAALAVFAEAAGGLVELARDGLTALPLTARLAAEALVDGGPTGPQGARPDAAASHVSVADALAVPVLRGGVRLGAVVAVGVDADTETLAWLALAAQVAALGWPAGSVCDDHGERDRRLAALGDLAGGIAHDFNNALTSVLGSVSLARLHGGLSDSLDDLLSEAEQACLRARRLTRQLLTFAGGGEPIRRAVDLGALVRDVVDEASADRRHRYALRVDEGMAAAFADEDQLRQAALFLIENARAVMPEGGEIRIRVHGRPADGELELSVEDRGPGLDAATLARIWDPYATGHSGIRGLALSAVHSIARRHGGSVLATSEPGVGSTLRLRVPAARPAPIVPAVSSEGGDRSGLHVLVMDDDATVRASLVRMLQHLGHRATAVDDGALVVGAWTGARQAGSPFDLCVMDLTVPHGVGGREAILRLREVDPAARAIVASGYSKDPIMARFRDHGFVGVLEKPCEMVSLARALRDAMHAAPTS